MSAEDRFPFGAVSTPRPARAPVRTPCDLAIVGVYPSALHVRWQLPRWAVESLGLREVVGALAVDVEPVVFWDGGVPDPVDLVAQWKGRVGFIDGDTAGAHGYVRPVMNGTSGKTVVGDVIEPLGIRPDRVFFTDLITRYFVKYGSRRRPQQGDRIRDIYQPFAIAADLPEARLPSRPTPRGLTAMASREERARLRDELVEAGAPLMVTLGAEARAVIEQIADESSGAPTRPLDRTDLKYAEPGRVAVGAYEASWCALTHPGNRSPQWETARARWLERAPNLM
jgi:hypothetical protein